jgi:hypothetical protein
MLKERGLTYWLRHSQKLTYVITVIYRARWNKRFEKDDYVPVNAKHLERVLGVRDAKPAVTALLDLNIIEANPHYKYKVGYRSKSYRFREPYRSGRFREVQTYERWSLPYHLRPEARIETEGTAQRFLFENLGRLTVDSSVDQFMREFQAENDFQRDSYERSIEWIRDKDWFFKADPNTGRVFNNVTSLPKVLRQFLRLDGKPLVEVDVANCQPLLLLGLYDGEGERDQFRQVAQNGTFYECLDSELEKPYGAQRRDELKVKVFTQIFFDRVRAKPSKLCQAFARKFPVLYGKVLALKEPAYRNLALRLQTDEAAIVIGKVVDGIARTSKIPVLTVHDSLLTLAEHVDEVKQRMEFGFLGSLGVKPTLKVKTLVESPSTAILEPTADDLAAVPRIDC